SARPSRRGACSISSASSTTSRSSATATTASAGNERPRAMCGIAGIWHWDPQHRVDLEALKRMSPARWPRCPDSSGRFLEGSFGMTMRRLQVIDPEGGEQPVPSNDFRRVAVYNGEVYNYRVLQRELEDRGHYFRSSCDTEVVVNAFAEWGSA